MTLDIKGKYNILICISTLKEIFQHSLLMTPIFFENQEQFRAWLDKNHQKQTELLVGFYKVKSGKPSMTWSESVDQALCYGWIDGIRKSIDQESYSIRFTPRKPNSIWSNINIAKIEKLKKAGLLQPAGLKIFEIRKEENSRIYSHEKELSVLTEEYENLFKQDPSAWNFFNNQPPSYRKVITHWIMSAKQDKTRISRLNKTILYSKNQQRIK